MHGHPFRGEEATSAKVTHKTVSISRREVYADGLRSKRINSRHTPYSIPVKNATLRLARGATGLLTSVVPGDNHIGEHLTSWGNEVLDEIPACSVENEDNVDTILFPQEIIAPLGSPIRLHCERAFTAYASTSISRVGNVIITPSRDENELLTRPEEDIASDPRIKSQHTGGVPTTQDAAAATGEQAEPQTHKYGTEVFPGELELPYLCHWRGCGHSFAFIESKEITLHLRKAHGADMVPTEHKQIKCQWDGCGSRVKPLHAGRHVFVYHL